MSSMRPGHKPRAILSFINWDQRHRDLRGLLAQAFQANNHFSEGYILNAIEADASEEMGEPLLWYPVAHMVKEFRAGMYPRDGRKHEKALGSHFTLLQDSYYEHTKLTLILDKGGGGGTGGRASPSPPVVNGGGGGGAGGGGPGGGGGSGGGGREGRAKHLLVLAYKSLEDSTDPHLLEGWVRWSGAWEAYTHLQEKKLPVSTITLYVRENNMMVTKKPKETFKYVVLLR
ncbi:transcription factor Maf-like [Homarus americanus]|uniref:transcription factor Maf-like n=1 Tax=Homarus americanus TaxID=6706 RepID=UPI001C494BB0|nr:transcription factor Maf-like [Homarus americanus]